MNKTERAFNLLFQSNSLKKDEKDRFISELETALKIYNFEKVSKIFGGERKFNKTVRFEKLVNDGLGHWIEFTFDKYGSRNFYVTFGSSLTSQKFENITFLNLVRKRHQEQYWWGPKWHSICRKCAWKKSTKQVVSFVPFMIKHIDEGGSDLSPSSTKRRGVLVV